MPEQPLDTNASPQGLPLGIIEPNPFQPRQTFDPEGLQELATSISESGVLQPVVVRPHPEVDGRYQLVVGERRWRASQMAGLEHIPSIVRDLDDTELALFSLVENLQRRDLHFIEEARAFRHILEKFGFTQAQLARHVGKSQASVANKLRLLGLPPDLQDTILSSPAVSERHARALLGAPEHQRRQALELIQARGWTVKQTEDWVKRAAAPEKQVTSVFKDVRIFLNTFRHAVSALREAGVSADIDEADLGDSYQVTVTIPKTAGQTARTRRVKGRVR